ncbi:hypothetical protein C900_05710 [Fulvivirga imtechensis AK7]|uniref:Uncharacterized protein n=1 Tax=Fulvivirga imtechensis AK7 TaxID=1237149 RepID=L8JMZ2_9BACT|nr:hypothetical protein [Fulvivirga imtechensis]ELR68884.1 hypothetical protein C900_05710 [Fulvivirga imtechensis AK7]
MKALTITPNPYSMEKEAVKTQKAVKKDCKAPDFEWQSYLKEDHNHNIALSLFNK